MSIDKIFDIFENLNTLNDDAFFIFPRHRIVNYKKINCITQNLIEEVSKIINGKTESELETEENKNLLKLKILTEKIYKIANNNEPFLGLVVINSYELNKILTDFPMTITYAIDEARKSENKNVSESKSEQSEISEIHNLTKELVKLYQNSVPIFSGKVILNVKKINSIIKNITDAIEKAENTNKDATNEKNPYIKLQNSIEQLKKILNSGFSFMSVLVIIDIKEFGEIINSLP